MNYKQVAGVANADFRDKWVSSVLAKYLSSFEKNESAQDQTSLLDIGAGTSPYRKEIETLGYSYRSHDFSQYIPSSNVPGLQNSEWVYPLHDFVCDITKIPDAARSDFVLCTEVLEHVPDPVSAFSRISSLVNPGGYLIISVPFLSLMHQSPYWFSAGLSPFWFEHWSKESGLVIEELTVQGDYVDLMAQEVSRLLTFNPHIKGLNRTGSRFVKSLRKRLPTEVLESGGFGTLFIGRAIG